MDILFLITSFIFAIVVPLINISYLGGKGFIYAFIMILFIFVVFAYVILSVYKLKISKIDYLKSKCIVSWDIAHEKKNSKVHYVISLISGLAFGIFVYFKNIGLISSILLALACAFCVLGWWLMGIKRLEYKLSETDSFLLAHMGLIYKGDILIFNGYSKGITSARKENSTLVLSLLKNKKITEIQLEIPENKIEDVDNFLKDLNEFFDGVNDEK